MPITRVFIAKDGKVVVEGIGYIGQHCIKDAEKLREILRTLGVEVDIELQQRKPEYYAAEASTNEQQA